MLFRSPRASDLRARLLGITAVGEESRASSEPGVPSARRLCARWAGEEEQQPAAAGVTAEVAQVRRMGDQEAVEVLAVQGLLELLLPRSVVHIRNKAGAFGSGPFTTQGDRKELVV